MTIIERLARKRTLIVAGVMSGTSADTADAVIARIGGEGRSLRLTELGFHALRYPRGYREHLLRCSQPGGGSVDEISSLNILAAQFFAGAVRGAAKDAGLPLSRIDLIGSHGQTIHHLPLPKKMFGRTVRSTLQIGDPSTIAALTGITTVGNFRTADMAHGGQGAPLVPYFDHALFSHPTKNRAVLNIGGIANITLLPKGCTPDEVIAFDTGPGNMVIDAAMQLLFSRPMDRNGAVAARGRLRPEILSHLMAHPYFAQRPPKSAGREIFGEEFLFALIRRFPTVSTVDLVTNITEWTPLSIADQYLRFLRKGLKGDILDELIVSGGGTKNAVMMSALQRLFPDTEVRNSDALGVRSASKEALCFALLARATVRGTASNLPSVTGATRRTPLGTIALTV